MSQIVENGEKRYFFPVEMKEKGHIYIFIKLLFNGKADFLALRHRNK